MSWRCLLLGHDCRVSFYVWPLGLKRSSHPLSGLKCQCVRCGKEWDDTRHAALQVSPAPEGLSVHLFMGRSHLYWALIGSPHPSGSPRRFPWVD
jgi:hypothetical protein